MDKERRRAHLMTLGMSLQTVRGMGQKKKVIKKEKKGRKKNTKSIGDGAFEPTRWITSGFYHR